MYQGLSQYNKILLLHERKSRARAGTAILEVYQVRTTVHRELYLFAAIVRCTHTYTILGLINHPGRHFLFFITCGGILPQGGI